VFFTVNVNEKMLLFASRTFLSLTVSTPGDILQEYTQAVDECFEEYKLQKYYEVRISNHCANKMTSFKVWVRIDPSHPFVCRKRQLNGAVLRMRPEKPRPCITASVAR
jgi:hypothetical protein